MPAGSGVRAPDQRRGVTSGSRLSATVERNSRSAKNSPMIAATSSLRESLALLLGVAEVAEEREVVILKLVACG
jgi:hypothetical protein